MEYGVIKWFNMAKGFGFILPESGGADVFVHANACRRAGIAAMRPGLRIAFTRAGHGGLFSAETVEIDARGAGIARRLAERSAELAKGAPDEVADAELMRAAAEALMAGAAA